MCTRNGVHKELRWHPSKWMRTISQKTYEEKLNNKKIAQSQAKIWEFCHIIYNGVVNRAREQFVHLFRLALSHKIDSSKWFYAMYKFYLWCTIYDDDRINLISPQSFGYYTQYRAHSQSYTHIICFSSFTTTARIEN